MPIDTVLLTSHLHWRSIVFRITNKVLFHLLYRFAWRVRHCLFPPYRYVTLVVVRHERRYEGQTNSIFHSCCSQGFLCSETCLCLVCVNSNLNDEAYVIKNRRQPDILLPSIFITRSSLLYRCACVKPQTPPYTHHHYNNNQQKEFSQHTPT